MVSQDNQQLVLESKTGFPIPGDVEFMEYQGKQARKSGGHGKKGKVGVVSIGEGDRWQGKHWYGYVGVVGIVQGSKGKVGVVSSWGTAMWVWSVELSARRERWVRWVGVVSQGECRLYRLCVIGRWSLGRTMGISPRSSSAGSCSTGSTSSRHSSTRHSQTSTSRSHGRSHAQSQVM